MAARRRVSGAEEHAARGTKDLADAMTLTKSLLGEHVNAIIKGLEAVPLRGSQPGGL
jgi:hypothetical protein